VQLPPFSCYFIPLRSKYSPEISVLKHPQSVIFQLGAIISCEPDISVRIVSGYRLDDRVFSSNLCVHWGPPSLLYNWYRGFFPRG
jgi:hypothetical protein